MRASHLTLLASAAAASLTLTACGGAAEPPFLPEESPPATATAAEPGGMDGFREFARRIDEALVNADAGFILESALISDYECQDTGLQLANCVNMPAGTTFSGIYSARWNSDFVELISPDKVAQHFRDFVSAGSAARIDSFGTGEARLHALTWTAPAPPERPFFVPSFGPLPRKEIFQAVLTSIPAQASDPYGQPIRICLIYRFFAEDGRWQLFEEITGVCDDGWLTGECSECYDHWERWEGTP